MKKIAILSTLMLLAANVASAAITVNTVPTSLVTSSITAVASSSPVGLFAFKLTSDAAESLSTVTVTINAAGGSSVSSSDLAQLAVYKDNNANGTFESGTDLVAGTQTTVNIGSPTTITVSSNNSLTIGTTFFVTLSTGATWSSTVSPVDSVTATLGATGIVTSANSPTVVAVTTNTISAPDTTGPVLTAAAAGNVAGTKKVVLTFGEATNAPVINSTNINSAVALNNSHSWLDGNGGLGTAVWSGDSKTLTVSLTSAISSPTIAVGDTVTMGTVIKDASNNNAAGSATISGSFVGALTPALSTAVASNAGNNAGLGTGDSVALAFNSATNKPTINAANIASVLVLNNSHSWLDGAASIGSALWSADGKTLTITLSAGTSVPTIAVGDTVTTTGSTIKDSTGTNNATGVATISGSFSGSTNNGDGDDNDEQEGHSCANNLINGRLYKTADSSTVYLAAACRLKPFRGAAVFHARGNKFKNIITLASLTGLDVSNQPALPADGTLVKGSGQTIWFVEIGKKRKGFASAAIFLALGFKFDQVNIISDDDLNTMLEDPTPVVTDTTHPDGALIKCTNSSTIFQVQGNTQTAFTNLDSFELRGHTFNQVATIDCGKFHYVIGAAINN